MARYPLNLPKQLKKDAEEFASEQGVSLNQFILWAVAEKIGGLREAMRNHGSQTGNMVYLERDSWLRLSQNRLANAYGEDEVSYSLELIKEPNPDYEGR